MVQSRYSNRKFMIGWWFFHLKVHEWVERNYNHNLYNKSYVYKVVPFIGKFQELGHEWIGSFLILFLLLCIWKLINGQHLGFCYLCGNFFSTHPDSLSSYCISYYVFFCPHLARHLSKETRWRICSQRIFPPRWKEIHNVFPPILLSVYLVWFWLVDISWSDLSLYY